MHKHIITKYKQLGLRLSKMYWISGAILADPRFFTQQNPAL